MHDIFDTANILFLLASHASFHQVADFSFIIANFLFLLLGWLGGHVGIIPTFIETHIARLQHLTGNDLTLVVLQDSLNIWKVIYRCSFRACIWIYQLLLMVNFVAWYHKHPFVDMFVPITLENIELLILESWLSSKQKIVLRNLNLLDHGWLHAALINFAFLILPLLKTVRVILSQLLGLPGDGVLVQIWVGAHVWHI